MPRKVETSNKTAFWGFAEIFGGFVALSFPIWVQMAQMLSNFLPTSQFQQFAARSTIGRKWFPVSECLENETALDVIFSFLLIESLITQTLPISWEQVCFCCRRTHSGGNVGNRSRTALVWTAKGGYEKHLPPGQGGHRSTWWQFCTTQCGIHGKAQNAWFIW